MNYSTVKDDRDKEDDVDEEKETEINNSVSIKYEVINAIPPAPQLKTINIVYNIYSYFGV